MLAKVIYSPTDYLDGMPPRSKVFGYGNPVGNPLTSHMHCLTACVYHIFLRGWFLIIGNLGLCRSFTGNLGLLFPKKSVTSVGVDNV